MVAGANTTIDSIINTIIAAIVNEFADTSAGGAAAHAIRFRGVSKRYAGIVALNDVSFDVSAGSCHAICGENGAGKSTLGRILAGVHRRDAGSIEIDGAPVDFASPREALQAGVAMVHQELAFCENMSVGENLCLGEMPTRFGFVDRREVRARATNLLDAVGADIDPDRAMASLSVAEQQLVQIAAAVGERARIIVFDEPTSSLGPAESAALYTLMTRLRARGVTLVFVSHRMAEIFQLCDAITVLRDGAHVATQSTSSVTEAALVRQMIGRDVASYFPRHADQSLGDELLRVTGLSSRGKFDDISFSLRAGEIVGLAGLVGAGRSEIAAALFGLDPNATGQISVRGANVSIRSATEAMRHGIGFVPEDRKKHGLVLGMRARENATLPTLRQYERMGFVRQNAERAAASTSLARVAFRASPESVAGSLSGGNQQKVVLSKWLTAGSTILILDEPTRGVDVGAKAELHAWIEQKASDGAAILLISSELPELLNVSTRILVIREGHMQGALSRAEATQDRVLRLMSGID